MPLIFVDVEASGPSPSTGKMTEFGAVNYDNDMSFHGHGDDTHTMASFAIWLDSFRLAGSPVFVSDNVAFDWQWINDAFWKHGIPNPFGHSGRRISDFYAGLRKDFRKTQNWKKWRVPKHDHNPVHDAQGNVTAFKRMLVEYDVECLGKQADRPTPAAGDLY